MGLLILISFFSGCAETPPSPQTSQLLQHYREVLNNATSEKPLAEEEGLLKIEPKFKELSPLSKRISVSFYKEHYENIFFFLALESGLSIVIDPELKKYIPAEKERVTLQLKNQPLEVVLGKLCEILDISYKIDRGVLKILPYEERIISLGFLPVVKEGKSQLGGDVLGNIGGVGPGATAPIKGDFSVQANLSAETLNVYNIIENSVSLMLSKEGIYNLNKMTGTLYVKDRPSRVNSIARIIEDYKKKYKRQIILDAQIIEIALSSGHNLGVDWFEITNLLLGTNRVSLNTLDLGITPRENLPSLSLTISGQPNLNILLNLLKQYGELKVISNPKIRVLHSQPALISVGTSYSYIREVTRSYDNATGRYTYTSVTSSVFDGIMLGLIPFIAEEDEIYLHIVPIKSDLLELRNVNFENIQLNLPILNLREMTSIVKVKPNDLIVIGGLILDKSKTNEKRIAIPLLDQLFKQSTKEGTNSELVILIRLLVN